MSGSCTNKTQHAVGCEYIHTMVKGWQLTVYCTAGVRRELQYQFITARNRKPPGSTKAFVSTVRGIKHHYVASSGIFVDQFPELQPREWPKLAMITTEGATEAYMVEVIAASHSLKQHLISCRCSTCLLRWQGTGVVYSWNSPTCAWPWTWPKWPKNGFRTPQ